MSDTTAQAAKVQVEVQRRLSPSQRFRVALDMSTAARSLNLARLRREHPEWDEARVNAAHVAAVLPPGTP